MVGTFNQRIIKYVEDLYTFIIIKACCKGYVDEGMNDKRNYLTILEKDPTN